MVTITVDDNPKIIKPIIKMLTKIDPSGTHLSAGSGDEALDLLKRNNVYVIFLDIEMPAMNGLEAARKIRALCPKTNIIFITGYSEYALEAFSVYASGYLLKPITENQIREALDNLRYPNQPPIDQKIRVRCFGQFEAWYNGEPIKFTRTLTKTLFAYLIDRRGAMCDTGQMICAVWPEGVVNQTYSSYLRMLISDLQTTLTMLGVGETLFRSRGTVGINTEMVDCDYYKYLRGDEDAVRQYHGEYMTQFEFAEETRYYLLKEK